MSAGRRAAPSRRQQFLWRPHLRPNQSHPRPWGGGRRRGFAKHCFAPPQLAGSAMPAVERGVGI